MKLSYSQLKTYLSCPRQFEYAYVKKVKRPISSAESFGSSVHNALKRWGELELNNQKSLEVTDQIQLFTEDSKEEGLNLNLKKLQECWVSAFSPHGFGDKAAADEAFKRGEKLMEQFYKWWSQNTRKVLAIETGFRLNLGEGIDLSGRFDRVEETAEGVHIIDFKTSAPPPQQQVNGDLQLSIYSLAAQEVFKSPCKRLTLLCLKADEVVEINTIRSKDQLDRAINIIKKNGNLITDKEFTALPEVKTCKRCPFNRICEFARFE